MNRVTLLTAWALIAAACAPDLRVDHPFDGTGKCIDPVSKAEVDCALVPLVTVERDGALSNMIVDATNKESKVYVDLDTGREMKTDEAFETNGWDLAFMRFDITSNGGSSSPGGPVEIAVLDGAAFDAFSQAPSTGYEQDGAVSVFNGVNGGWYYYDLGAHRLTTNDKLYIVKTTDGMYMKLRMGSYYDSAGTAARLSLSYAKVSAP